MVDPGKLEELAAMADEIENELGMCDKNIKKLGSASIKTQSFHNMVNKEDQGDRNIKQLQMKARYFLNRVKTFNDMRSKERSEFEQEMADSKIQVKKISETYDPDHELKEREFYSKQSNKLDSFIISTMDSLDSIKRQGVFIQRANERLKNGLMRLGVSGELIDKIEVRFARDKTLFMVLFGSVLFFIVLLRFYFR